jgi:ABC-type polysaccharide/polyol phosphate transport system ATPase subunit
VEAAPVIEFDRVSKRYRSMRERHNLRQAVPGPFGDRVVRDIHQALADVSFELGPGDSLGIVGPNGAGKSTILKLIARVTAPTTGAVRVRGRVAALIELGAGFHPDMTGRENIYFSAAVLGMRPRDTAGRLDEIVDFADIGRYIDAPIKRYSAGMLARLGFAVASHLEADVILIDEVLSVGDAEFRQRCHDRIQTLRDEGLAVLFVSHDLDTVPKLCRRAVFLRDGGVVARGAPEEVIEAYLAGGRRAG